MTEADQYRAAIDLAQAYNSHENDVVYLTGRIVQLEGHIRTMREIGGCRCDPVGSGEEWCVGACYLREALSYIAVYSDSGPIVREIARKALQRDEQNAAQALR